MKFKSPDSSKIETRYIVMPEHTNHYGTAFGGVIISWIDIAAAMVAEKHCGHEVVTVSIDKVVFLSPIYVGDHVVLKARVNYTGRTSMEIEVEVFKENPVNNVKTKTTTAFLTFVGLDKNKKPKKVPQLLLENDDDKRRFLEAKIRVERRKNSNYT
jgi:uncharacterized protein (TIGR00369 family)